MRVDTGSGNEDSDEEPLASAPAERPVPLLSPLLLGGTLISLVGITFLAYAGVLSNGFLQWDDNFYITENPGIRSLDPRRLVWIFGTGVASNWHPLTWLSHVVDYAIFGLDPRGHHLVGVLLHCANTLWVFALAIVLLPLVGDASPRSTWPRRPGISVALAAFVAALLFGVHPQHVESVAWASERKDLLFFFFLVPCVITYLLYVRAGVSKARRPWYLVSVLCFALSISAKPMAVTTPLVLLLLDLYPLRRTRLARFTDGSRSDNLGFLQLLIEKIPFFLISLGIVLITFFAQTAAIVPVGSRGLGYRFLNAVDSLFAYLVRWMAPFDLSPVYPHASGYAGLAFDGSRIVLETAVLVAISALVVSLWRGGRRAWLPAWLVYLITMAPVIGIVAVGNQASADRYTYWPTLPLYLAVGAGFARGFFAAPSRAALRVGSAVVLLVITGTMIQLTREQVAIWRDDLTFWRYVEARHPDDFIVQSGLGLAYQRAGERVPAARHLRDAVERIDGFPDLVIHVDVRTNLALVLLDLEEWDEAQSILDGIESDLHREARASMHARLVRQHCRQRRFDPAREQSQKARALNPSEPGIEAQARALAEERCF